MIDVTWQYVGTLKPLSQNIWIDQDEWAAFGQFLCDAEAEPQGEKMIVLLVRAILCADDRTTRAVVQMGRAYRLHGVSRRLRTAPCCVREFPGKWVDLGRDLLDRKGSVSNSRTGIKIAKLCGICYFCDVSDRLLEGG
jgi:hypothetical protein